MESEFGKVGRKTFIDKGTKITGTSRRSKKDQSRRKEYILRKKITYVINTRK